MAVVYQQVRSRVFPRSVARADSSSEGSRQQNHAVLRPGLFQDQSFVVLGLRPAARAVGKKGRSPQRSVFRTSGLWSAGLSVESGGRRELRDKLVSV